MSAEGEITPLNESQRRNANLLLVESDAFVRQRMREFLLGLGFASISEVSDHTAGIAKIKERNFTHVIFCTESTSADLESFMRQLGKFDRAVIPIAVAKKPDSEQLFELLQLGAKAYVVHPITQEQIESAIALATNGKAIPDAILTAEDRNRSLALMVSNSLDNAARAMHAPNVSGRTGELKRFKEIFRRSAEVARIFAKGGAQYLLQSIEEVFTAKAQGPATRLGRVRQQLNQKRAERRKNP